MKSQKLKQLLYNYYFCCFSSEENKNGPVFIIGTGRSGTHFLCSCMNHFPGLDDFFGGKESKYMFDFISELTLYGQKLALPVIKYYHYMQKKVAPALFLDQTHPNIWHVEELLMHFPKAKFIAISRDLYSVIFSMKNHRGVSDWARNHRQYPKPNNFLGISAKNTNLYEECLSDVQRYTFRWCAHEDRIRDLEESFPDSVLSVSYETLAYDMRNQMTRISEFIGVNPPFEYSEFSEQSLYKKESLTDTEVSEVAEALRLYYEH